MTTEIARQLVNPVTGELILATELRQVADAIEQVRSVKRQLDDAIAELTEVLTEHSRKIGTHTFSVKGRTVVVSSDKELVWDVEYLTRALSAAGLPEERMIELVTTTVTHKVSASVANQLAAANPEYAEIIERAKSYEPKKQYVSLRPVNEVQK